MDAYQFFLRLNSTCNVMDNLLVTEEEFEEFVEASEEFFKSVIPLFSQVTRKIAGNIEVPLRVLARELPFEKSLNNATGQ